MHVRPSVEIQVGIMSPPFWKILEFFPNVVNVSSISTHLKSDLSDIYRIRGTYGDAGIIVGAAYRQHRALAHIS